MFNLFLLSLMFFCSYQTTLKTNIKNLNSIAKAEAKINEKNSNQEKEFYEIFKEAEMGFCVDENNRDVNEGVKLLKRGEFKTKEQRQECRRLCALEEKVTACELVWDQGNRGCYVHTSDAVDHGNKRDNHACYVVSPLLKEKQFHLESKGFCVDRRNRDVDNGQVKLREGDFTTKEKRRECLLLCEEYEKSTGCEIIFNQGNKGCYAHTSPLIDHGNGRENHICFTF